MRKSKRAVDSDLRKVDLHGIVPHEYEEAPELSDEQLANSVLSVGQAARPPALGTIKAGDQEWHQGISGA
jgi:hypothetical protein